MRDFVVSNLKKMDYQLRSLKKLDRTYIDDVVNRITWNNNPSFDFDIKGHRNINEDIKRRPDDGEQQQIWNESRGGIFRDIFLELV